MNTFFPNRKLALRAAIYEARQMARSTMKQKVIVVGATSGMMLAVNLLRHFTHGSVSIMQWIGSALAAPLLLFLGFALQYATYRFASPVSISSAGLQFGWQGHLLAFWKPVECKVIEYEDSLFRVTIYCTNPLNAKPRPVYFGLTDSPASAEEFLQMFRQQYCTLQIDEGT
jgi:hypothetical protein